MSTKLIMLLDIRMSGMKNKLKFVQLVIAGAITFSILWL
ncbi:hypothetical protein XIS1_190011 [Xenorhabdus innexi]|uniref:Uncharacterized protein n=1 Tax=Xenorhabdus innexi TaxID=290109 RepID=A0A1N6MX66_9GAMM|nr:hypothetical protein XIS1_190011 [Xenorhabdus innexi]